MFCPTNCQNKCEPGNRELQKIRRGRRREASDDKKKEANVRSNSQSRSPSIPHHTKTTTPLGVSTTTYTNCRYSKPKTHGQTKTTVEGLICSIGSTTYTSRYTTRTPKGEIYISIKKSKRVVSITFVISPTSSTRGSITNHRNNFK